jgi:anti-sigma regulatory factor (Ser/Thr protein kinase)
VKETEDLASEAQRAARRRRRWTLFFAAWTAFAIIAAWRLALRGSPGDSGASLIIDHGNASQTSLGEQIRVWLRLADLNFHGAYPWLLFAPYVLLLAARFPLERGRLRLNLPLHLGAFMMFAAVSGWLLSRGESGAIGLVIVSHHTQGAPFPWPANSNGAPFQWDADLPNLMTNDAADSFPAGNFTATTVVRSAGGEERTVQLSFPTNLPPGTGGVLGIRSPATRELIETEAGINLARETISKRITAWSTGWQGGRKPLSLLLDLLAYGMLIGSAHAVHFYRRFREREQRALLLESHLASARLHALQAQLHPHFLFNALNAVATLIRSDANAALETLTSFSELLRLALSQSEKQEVPLREDLRFLQRYMEIQQVRLGARLRFEQEVDPPALECLVPALLLHLLAENAIRHGIEPASHPGVVRLVVRRTGARLWLSVEDNGAGLAATAISPSGIGLANLRARLKLLYGDAQNLEIGERNGGGVAVTIKIPAREEGADPTREFAARP